MRDNMKYFKKLSTLLIIVMILSIVSGVFAVKTTDNGIQSGPTKTLDKTASKTICCPRNDKNNGLTPKLKEIEL